MAQNPTYDVTSPSQTPRRIGRTSSTSATGETFTTIAAVLPETPIYRFQNQGVEAVRVLGDGRTWQAPLSADPSVVTTGDLWLQTTGGTTSPRYRGVQGTETVATQSWVALLTNGLNNKQYVRACATSNITLSGPQTVDGVALIAGDPCLVTGQSAPANNGIYLVAAGAWTRRADADTWAELISASCTVSEGTVNADTWWVCRADAGGTLGSTALNWVQFAQPGVIVGSNLGSGAQLYASKVGTTLNFRSILGTANQITATQNTNDVTLSLPNTLTVPGSLTVSNGFTVSAGTLTLPAASIPDSALSGNVLRLGNTETYTATPGVGLSTGSSVIWNVTSYSTVAVTVPILNYNRVNCTYTGIPLEGSHIVVTGGLYTDTSACSMSGYGVEGRCDTSGSGQYFGTLGKLNFVKTGSVYPAGPFPGGYAAGLTAVTSYYLADGSTPDTTAGLYATGLLCQQIVGGDPLLRSSVMGFDRFLTYSSQAGTYSNGAFYAPNGGISVGTTGYFGGEVTIGGNILTAGGLISLAKSQNSATVISITNGSAAASAYSAVQCSSDVATVQLLSTSSTEGVYGPNMGVLGTIGAHALAFITTNVVRAKLFASGGFYVGSTPTDPGANSLTVQGSVTVLHRTAAINAVALFGGTSNAGDNNYIQVRNSTKAWNIGVDGSLSDRLYVYTGSAGNVLSAFGSGGVYIGATASDPGADNLRVQGLVTAGANSLFTGAFTASTDASPSVGIAGFRVQNTATLGSTAGNRVTLVNITSPSSNVDYLQIFHRRVSAGSDWQTAEIRIQKVVDTASMDYIAFRGSVFFGGPTGIVLGSGVQDRMFIDSAGGVCIGATYVAAGAGNLAVSGVGSFAGGYLYTAGTTGVPSVAANAHYTVSDGWRIIRSAPASASRVWDLTVSDTAMQYRVVDGAYTGAFTYMTVSRTGNTDASVRFDTATGVSIGMAAAGAGAPNSLSIAGTVGIGLGASAASTEKLQIGDGTRRITFGLDTNMPWFGTGSNHDLRFLSNGIERFRLFASGGLYVGSAAVDPGINNLTVQGTATVAKLASSYTGSGQAFNLDIVNTWNGASSGGILGAMIMALNHSGSAGVVANQIIRATYTKNSGAIAAGTTFGASGVELISTFNETETNGFTAFHSVPTVATGKTLNALTAFLAGGVGGAGTVTTLRAFVAETGAGASQFADGVYIGSSYSAPGANNLMVQGTITGNVGMVLNTARTGNTVRLYDNGSSSKWIRSEAGQFQILNNAFSLQLLTVDDAGNLNHTGSIQDNSLVLYAPSTGTTQTIADSVSTAVISNGTLASLTVKMPATPANGQIVRVLFGGAVTALTMTPNSGQTLSAGSPTTAAVGATVSYIYRTTGTTWYILSKNA